MSGAIGYDAIILMQKTQPMRWGNVREAMTSGNARNVDMPFVKTMPIWRGIRMGLDDYEGGNRPDKIAANVRWCAKCGASHDYGYAAIDIAKRLGSRLRCPHCGRVSKLSKMLTHPPDAIEGLEEALAAPEETDERIEHDGEDE
jgi:hypothetical protein